MDWNSNIFWIWFLPTSGISSCGISQGEIISVNWLLCYRFFVNCFFFSFLIYLSHFLLTPSITWITLFIRPLSLGLLLFTLCHRSPRSVQVESPVLHKLLFQSRELPTQSLLNCSLTPPFSRPIISRPHLLPYPLFSFPFPLFSFPLLVRSLVVNSREIQIFASPPSLFWWP